MARNPGLKVSEFLRNYKPDIAILDDPTALAWRAQGNGFFDNGTWRIDRTPNQDGTLETNDLEAAQAYINTFNEVLPGPRGPLSAEDLNAHLGAVERAAPAFELILEKTAQISEAVGDTQAALGGLNAIPAALEELTSIGRQQVLTNTQLVNSNLLLAKRITAPQGKRENPPPWDPFFFQGHYAKTQRREGD